MDILTLSTGVAAGILVAAIAIFSFRQLMIEDEDMTWWTVLGFVLPMLFIASGFYSAT